MRETTQIEEFLNFGSSMPKAQNELTEDQVASGSDQSPAMYIFT
jgi:hypothetical protein